MKRNTPDQITIVAQVGHDDQYENNDIDYCAVRITSKGLPKLKQRLAFYADHKDSVALYGVDFEMFDGIGVCFFDLDHMGPMRDEIDQALQKANGKAVYWGAEAEAVWYQAEASESKSAWRTSGSSLKIYDKDLFYLESGYKYATGSAQTPDFDLLEVQGYFIEKGCSANTDKLQIKPKGDGNLFEELADDYQEGSPIWREIGREDYWSALEALPALDYDGCDFLMGRPCANTESDVVYRGFVKIGFQDGGQCWDRYFASQIERSKFKAAALALRQYIFPRGY